jgi:hypothetical protein
MCITYLMKITYFVRRNAGDFFENSFSIMPHDLPGRVHDRKKINQSRVRRVLRAGGMELPGM